MATNKRRITLQKLLPLVTAMSITLSAMPLAFAGPGDTNSTNVGGVVKGGEYYNTNDSKTTFVGQNGSLWIKNGTIVRGLEVDGSNNLTGNGGNLHFSSPGGVIRVDGEVNASGLMGRGYATNNGGRVTLDAAFLYQNGRIFADGGNGGLVQFNVGSAVFSPDSITSARGLGGAGGSIVVNSAGAVDIQRDYGSANRAAILDSSGQYIGSIDSSVINIQGSVVNIDGIARANGYVVADNGIVSLYNENIQGPATATQAVRDFIIPNALKPQVGTLMTTGSEGGTIRIASTGTGGEGNNGSCIGECAINRVTGINIEDPNGGASAPIFNSGEATTIKNGLVSLLNRDNGDIVVGSRGVIQADGSSVAFLPGSLLGRKFVNLGYGYYEDRGLLGSAIDVFNNNVPNNYEVGGRGGTILMNAQANVQIKTDGFNGGLLSTRGGDGNGNSYRRFGRTISQAYNGGNGGLISVNAEQDIFFAGSAHAFGGNGYQNNRALTQAETDWLQDNDKNLPSGYIFDNQDDANGGLGGNGGLIAFSYENRFNNRVIDSLNGFTQVSTTKDFVNYQQIDASGGHTGVNPGNTIDGFLNPWGGLVVFSGKQNPNNLGNVSVYRGQGPDLAVTIDYNRFGTVVLPDASNVTSQNQLRSVNTNFKPDSTDLKIDQLRPDEILVGRDSLLVLSNSNILSVEDKIDNGIVRSADPAYQAGNGGILLDNAGASINNLLVSNMFSNRLILDAPVGVENGTYAIGDLSNLTSLMVVNSSRPGSSQVINRNNSNWTVGSDNLAGGLINIMSDGKIFNNGNLLVQGPVADGGITLVSRHSIINRGLIGGVGDADGGASAILKACRNVFNDGLAGGVIQANGILNGGRVEILANNNILNTGLITANAESANNDAQGGSLFTYAGNNNLNFGTVSANAQGNGTDGSRGGFVRLHGNNLAANVDLNNLIGITDYGEGRVEATGSEVGGDVYLTSGNSCGVGCAPNERTTTLADADGTLNEIITGLLSQETLEGFSTFQNTPPTTTMDLAIDMTRPGSAVNLGNIDTRGATKDGQIWLVGDGQVGIGGGSTLNGVGIDYNGILNAPVPSVAFQNMLGAVNANGGRIRLVAGQVNGKSALEAVMCSNLPGVNTTPDGNQPGDGGFDFPNNFTIPDPDANVNNPGNGLLSDVFGLFQEYRIRNNDTIPEPNAPMVLGFAQPNMFLAQAYKPVTEEILALALLEYNRVLSDPNTATQGGESHQRAAQLTQIYLRDAGVDDDVAKALLEQIQNGSLKAHQDVVGVLKAMAEIPEQPAPAVEPTTQPENTDTLRQ